jgi:hypothetical protein
VASFVAAFATLGFATCADGLLETGVEKVALYVDAAGVPTHMARQLPSGAWTSKLGRLEDIEHDNPNRLAGPAPSYGKVALFLSRPILPAS